MRRLLFRIVIALMILPLASCGFIVVRTAKMAYSEYTRSEREVELALARYRDLVAQGEFDKAADLFDPAAKFSRDSEAIIVGRDAIRAFLKASAKNKVVEYELKPTSTSATGSKAIQQGTYRLGVTTPEHKSLVLKGSFEAEWVRQEGGSWLLHKMHVSPLSPK